MVRCDDACRRAPLIITTSVGWPFGSSATPFCGLQSSDQLSGIPDGFAGIRLFPTRAIAFRGNSWACRSAVEGARDKPLEAVATAAKGARAALVGPAVPALQAAQAGRAAPAASVAAPKSSICPAPMVVTVVPAAIAAWAALPAALAAQAILVQAARPVQAVPVASVALAVRVAWAGQLSCRPTTTGCLACRVMSAESVRQARWVRPAQPALQARRVKPATQP